MILFTKTEILFSQPNASLLTDGDPRKQPIVKELVSAHVCPRCSVPVQMIYKTDARIKDLTQQAFRLEKPLSASKMSVSTPGHQVQPKYKSYMVRVAGQSVEMLREESHFSIVGTVIFGQCSNKRVVHFPGPFNLTLYLFGLARAVTSVEWYQADQPTWAKLVEGLSGPDAERNLRNASQLFDEIKGRISVAEDLTGNGPPLWLTGKGDWGYGSMSTAINRLDVPSKGVV